MRVHANQVNQNAQVDAFYAAERAAATKEAARTRRKLSEFADKLVAESGAGEISVVKLRGREQDRERNGRQNLPGKREAKVREGEMGSEEHTVSDWA